MLPQNRFLFFVLSHLVRIYDALLITRNDDDPPQAHKESIHIITNTLVDTYTQARAPAPRHDWPVGLRAAYEPSRNTL